MTADKFRNQMGQTMTAYNKADQLTQTDYADGTKVSYTYDHVGRLIERNGFIANPSTGSGQAPSDSTHFVYNNGNLSGAKNEDAQISRKYDPLNQWHWGQYVTADKLGIQKTLVPSYDTGQQSRF